MGTRGEPQVDAHSSSQVFAALPQSLSKGSDISSQWSLPSNVHAWAPTSSMEASSAPILLPSQGSKEMHQIRVLESQVPAERLSSHLPQPSQLLSQQSGSASPQPSPLSSEQPSFPSVHSSNSAGVSMTSQSELWVSQPSTEMFQEAHVSSPPTTPSRPVSPSVAANPPPARAPCSKVLKGQFLSGEHSVYDVDTQLPGETPQQLEVLPISVYGWDPALVAGRQIAVNRRYICYCLRPGSIRILSRNVPSRGLFQGHSQRVTDMAFFAENVHLLASASSDGRLLVWKILEVQGTDGKLQLSEQILLAMQFDGEWKDVHPRVCWHPHSQECLVTCINKYVLKIDLNEVWAKASSVEFTAEASLKCHITNLISGVQCIGLHANEVTDLSVSSKDTLCIASASKDGTVRIWGGKKMIPLAVFTPHEGQPVGSVAFVSPPNQPDETVLLTGGPTNRSLKLWVPVNATGSLNNSVWRSIQTLELKSSAEGNVEQAFFNKVCVVPQAGLVLLGNTKKHAMYSIHVDFGSSALATRMDYLVEFSMSMPILSLTAMADIVVNGKGIVQVFCVQTQVIQQYFLNVSLCIPPQDEEALLLQSSVVSNVFDLSRASSFNTAEAEKNNLASKFKEVSIEERTVSSGGNSSLACEHNLVPDSGSGFGSWVEVPNWVAATLKKTSRTGPIKEATDLVSKDTTSTRPLSPLAPVSEVLAVVPSGPPAEDRSLSVRPQFPSISTLSPENGDKSKVMEDEYIKVGAGTVSSGVSSYSDSQSVLTQSRLITPSELMAMACFEAAAVVADKLSKSAQPEEANFSLHNESLQIDTEAIPDSGWHQSETCSGGTMENMNTELVGVKDDVLMVTGPQLYGSEIGTTVKPQRSFEHDCQPEEIAHQGNTCPVVVSKQEREESFQISQAPLVTTTHVNNTKRKKNKNKTSDNDANAPMVSSTVSTQVSAHEDTDQVVVEGEETAQESIILPEISFEDLAVQVLSLQKSFDHLSALQKELQKHVSVAVGGPMARETKRMESFLEQSLENSFKAQTDSFWNQIDDEKRKREEFQQECLQQLTSVVSNFTDKEVTSAFDKMFKKEVPSIGPMIAQLASPNIDSIIATAVSDNFQGFHEKSITQLEKSLSGRLDMAIPWQVQNLFKTFGRHSLQDNLCACFEELLVPKFQSLCEDMIGQANAILYEEMAEYAAFKEQQLVSSCFALASVVKDAVASASSATSSLKGELEEGEKRFLVLAENASAKADSITLSGRQNSAEFQSKVNQALPSHRSDTSFDTTAKLSRLLREGKLEEAFTIALSLGNAAVVFWLCKQVDPKILFGVMPLPLSQGVLISLVQQLGCDLGKDSAQKLTWIQQAALALNPNDQVLASHMWPFLEQLYQNLQRQMALFSSNAKLANQARLVMHLVNSLLTTCK